MSGKKGAARNKDKGSAAAASPADKKGRPESKAQAETKAQAEPAAASKDAQPAAAGAGSTAAAAAEPGTVRATGRALLHGHASQNPLQGRAEPATDGEVAAAASEMTLADVADALPQSEGEDMLPVQMPLLSFVVEAPNGKSVKVEVLLVADIFAESLNIVVARAQATPADCILDVRQYLLDCPETCDITCYHLEYEASFVKPVAVRYLLFGCGVECHA